MKKFDLSSWPILIVSDKINALSDEGCWLQELIKQLETQQDCSIIMSVTYSDAVDIVYSREDLGTILIDWDLQSIGRGHSKTIMRNNRFANASDPQNKSAADLLAFIRERNKQIPVLLMIDRGSVEDIPDEIFTRINDTVWKLTDTSQFLSGRIERHVNEYINRVMPPFFNELQTYVKEYKYAWHTPGHMGGQGFLKSPSGTALHKFFGEDVLRADLSISVPELGSLLDHSGLTGEAEKYSAKIFGADETYYVLNGTSTCNQIIWRSQVSPNDKALVDRNCHKSLNYAMVITQADPTYMVPLRNGLGIIGPVDFSRLNKDESYKMSALTNSTYDGVCYDVRKVAEKLENVEIHHFDEAWYAYAKFHNLYKDHFAMELTHKLIFASQSTHKLLTAFSQASMIHVRFPLLQLNKKSETGEVSFHDLFNESYMMHGSTSPQYNMIASLEIATKMMADNGKVAWNDTIVEAIEMRKKIASIHKEQTDKGSWFFNMWQPKAIETETVEELRTNQKHWWINKPDEKNEWHGFDVKETYAMLDPIKLTFLCPGIDVNGNFKDNEPGIPAAIVTNYLINQGIVCEKSDYYSWLLLNSLGTTKGKQGGLLAELFKFKELYDSQALLEDVFPNLTEQYPDAYQGKTLMQHCSEMHAYIRDHELLSAMHEAYSNIPKSAMKPSDAYRCIVNKKVESVLLEDLKTTTEEKVIAVMLVPYPPGIPIMMGGEIFSKSGKDNSSPILDYLTARQNFEQEFPGYESDIHGIERANIDGKSYFKTLIIKQ